MTRGRGLSKFGDNQVPHQCIGKGQQGIKPLPLLSISLNFPSLRSGEMLAQYLNGGTLPGDGDGDGTTSGRDPMTVARG